MGVQHSHEGESAPSAALQLTTMSPATEAEAEAQLSFNVAVERVNSLLAGRSVPDSTKLALYGLFKQATVGDCVAPAPSIFEPVARHKHQAWMQHQGLSMSVAQQQYSQRVDTLLDELGLGTIITKINGGGVEGTAPHPIRHPSVGLNAAQLLTVQWLTPLIRKASGQGISAEDVWPAPPHMSTEASAKSLREAWAREVAAARELGRAPSLVRALYAAFWRRWHRAGRFQFAFMMLQFAQPFVIGQLIDAITGEREISLVMGLVLAGFLGFISIASSLCIATTLFNSRQLGLQVRTGVMMAVFDKSLKLTNASRMESSVGNVTNLMAIDAEKLFLAAQFLHFLWHGPCAFVLSLGALIFEVGPSAVAGFGLLAMLLPIQKRLSKIIGRARQRMAKASDRRVHLMSEVLQGIRVLKFMSWEDHMIGRVHAKRNAELRHVWTYQMFNGFLRELMFMAGPLTAVVIFSVFVFGARQDLTVQKMLRCLAFINILRFPMNLLGQAMKLAFDSKVSISRLERFLDLDTLPDDPADSAARCSEGRIELDHCVFTWGGANTHTTPAPSPPTAAAGRARAAERKEAEAPEAESLAQNRKEAGSPSLVALRDLSLTIGPGELVAVVGTVGSGKSALLGSILGELTRVQGTAHVTGSRAFMAQTPWIQGLTLRDNVLFGRSFEEAQRDGSYKRAIDAACLGPDLAVLPAGDETEIGERGFNLSGGQKARVAFARCLCHRAAAQLFVLDDPFSAVDSATGAAMFKEGVQGALQGTLRVVTLNSHLNLLSGFDRILVMADGRIAFDGGFDQLTEAHPQFVVAETDAEASSKPTALSNTVVDLAMLLPIVGEQGERKSDEASSPARGLGSPAPGIGTVVAPESVKVPGARSVSRSGALSLAERSATGNVAAEVYFRYIGAGLGSVDGKCVGFLGCALLLTLFIAAQSTRVFSDYAAARWSKHDGDSTAVGRRVVIYWFALGLTVVLLVLRTSLLNFFALRSSRHLHASVLQAVLNAPVPTFFDTHTVGEVLNRFAKDLEVLDVQIPEYLLQVLMNNLMVGSIFALCVASTFWFLIPLALLFWAFVAIFRVFRATSRDLKRLESTSRSPVYASFSEALAGLDTIRAFGAKDRFYRTHQEKMDRNVSYFFHLWMSLCWVTVRLETMGSAILFMVGLFAVLLKEYSQIKPVLLGMAMVYVLQLTALFQRCVQVLIDTETYMTSVERILEYLKAPQEIPRLLTAANGHVEAEQAATVANTVLNNSTTRPAWPSNGDVTFEGVCLRYRDGPLVLRNVSFTVPGGTRVGVCGRTGAGKSSVITALFRIVELEQGKITLDGCDVAAVALNRLRESVAIIPQDPIIFSGTLRSNLDPASKYPDADLYRVLEQVHLRGLVDRLPDGLESPVLEMGSNLSQGERQLLCFARALLRQAKVLVLDEATSAVDVETDALIQKVLREECEIKPTVLTIAHRLQTIGDYDRILVLGAGEVLEFGPPEELLQANGAFARMWAEAAAETAKESA